jgi:Ser/Thr protein kinase RdoA (MazF antagonist)
VLRVPTEHGDVWFKANADALRHEAALVTVLAGRRPDCVPPLLGADLERGWMLMVDAGTQLRHLQASERDLGRWLEILPLYAGLQLALAGDVDELLALGVPDLRLATLAERYEQVLDEVAVERRFRDAVPRVAELCEELAAYGIPETVQHDDLHDGQVFVRDGRYLLLDWGDACVSHPFFTLSVTLEGMLAWGLDDVENAVDTTPFRDAYLAPWSERYDGDLVAACGIALRLGWVCRTVNCHFGGGDPENTPVRLRMFLDGRSE